LKINGQVVFRTRLCL